MPEEPPEDKIEPKGTELKNVPTPQPVPASEREIYEGKIKDLAEKNAALEKRLEEISKPKPSPPREPKPEKRKTFLDRFAPL